ncbi:unnamed protein product [Choristocarpus tenellus]
MYLLICVCIHSLMDDAHVRTKNRKQLHNFFCRLCFMKPSSLFFFSFKICPCFLPILSYFVFCDHTYMYICNRSEAPLHDLLGRAPTQPDKKLFPPPPKFPTERIELSGLRKSIIDKYLFLFNTVFIFISIPLSLDSDQAFAKTQVQFFLVFEKLYFY